MERLKKKIEIISTKLAYINTYFSFVCIYYCTPLLTFILQEQYYTTEYWRFSWTLGPDHLLWSIYNDPNKICHHFCKNEKGQISYILAKLTLWLIATQIVFTISDENSDFRLIMGADDQPLAPKWNFFQHLYLIYLFLPTPQIRTQNT